MQKTPQKRIKDPRAKQQATVYFWVSSENRPCLWVTFQVESKSKRELKRVLKEIDGEHSGEGYDPVGGRMISLIRKKFEDRESFARFRKDLKIDIKKVKN